ncbi:protein of unknown function (plasmid) [Cupriavidus neocaledonicus]|uniref:Uncharacterized protein n=1 Tax=Cupriavidus neocaledonicus TaxID=1040979 RepID=A0A375HLE8_9BURK|nr:hypothetical protein CBM2605_B150039 [Cupriavidus neocaledonicus]SPD59068.1 protein of unknown function [Cupriavidus neocaledonicus]
MRHGMAWDLYIHIRKPSLFASARSDSIVSSLFL